MTYSPTIWSDGQAPAISAANLNKIEQELALQSAQFYTTADRIAPTDGRLTIPAGTQVVRTNSIGDLLIGYNVFNNDPEVTTGSVWSLRVDPSGSGGKVNGRSVGWTEVSDPVDEILGRRESATVMVVGDGVTRIGQTPAVLNVKMIKANVGTTTALSSTPVDLPMAGGSDLSDFPKPGYGVVFAAGSPKVIRWLGVDDAGDVLKGVYLPSGGTATVTAGTAVANVKSKNNNNLRVLGSSSANTGFAKPGGDLFPAGTGYCDIHYSALDFTEGAHAFTGVTGKTVTVSASSTITSGGGGTITVDAQELTMFGGSSGQLEFAGRVMSFTGKGGTNGARTFTGVQIISGASPLTVNPGDVLYGSFVIGNGTLVEMPQTAAWFKQAGQSYTAVGDGTSVAHTWYRPSEATTGRVLNDAAKTDLGSEYVEVDTHLIGDAIGGAYGGSWQVSTRRSDESLVNALLIDDRTRLYPGDPTGGGLNEWGYIKRAGGANLSSAALLGTGGDWAIGLNDPKSATPLGSGYHPRLYFGNDGGVAASKDTALGLANAELTFTAVTPGWEGNKISIQYKVAGNNTPLSVTCPGTSGYTRAVVVNLPTNAGGALIPTTAATVASLINTHSWISTFVTAANKVGNDGTGSVAAMAAVNLANGRSALGDVWFERTDANTMKLMSTGGKVALVAEQGGKTEAQLLAEGMGFKAQAFPITGHTVSQAPTSQQIYLIPVVVRANVTYSNVVVHATVIGSAGTSDRVCVYDTLDTATRLVAQSADVKATLRGGSPGYKVLPFPAYTPTADGVVYVAVLCDGGTPSTLSRAGSNAGEGTQLSANKVRAFAAGPAAQSSMPATLTVADGLFKFWAALS